MSKYTKEIIDFIDDKMTGVKSQEFIVNLNKNKEFNNEFLLIRDINDYMKGKLSSEAAAEDNNLLLIEKETKEDVSEFLLKGKEDKDVLDYLSVAFPENKLKKEIFEAGKEAQAHKIIDLTEEWVGELNKDEEKDPELLSLINHDQKGEKKDIYKNKMFVGRRRLYYWAASVAAIFVLLFLLNNVFDNTTESEKIFAEFHDKPHELMSIQIRGSEHDINTTFDEASALYKQKLYEEAYIEFYKLAVEEETFVQALFYSGLAQFEAGKYFESSQIFLQVISEFDEYEVESKWYLSLAYIKINEFNKAIPFLEDIARQKSLYQENSISLLKEIQN